MVEAIFQALAAGLSLWKSIEQRKYIDKLASLKRDYREETSKDPSLRSDAILDNIEFEVKLLANSFALSVGSGDGKKS